MKECRQYLINDGVNLQDTDVASSFPTAVVAYQFLQGARLKTIEPGGLQEQTAAGEVLNRFKECGIIMPGVENRGGVSSLVIDEVMDIIADRPLSSPLTEDYIKQIDHIYSTQDAKKTLTGGIRLLPSLISAIASPQYGVEAERITLKHYPQLDKDSPFWALKLRVARVKRSINGNPEGNLTPVVRALFHDLRSHQVRKSYNELFDECQSAVDQIIEAMHRAGIQGRKAEVDDAFGAELKDLLAKSEFAR